MTTAGRTLIRGSLCTAANVYCKQIPRSTLRLVPCTLSGAWQSDAANRRKRYFPSTSCYMSWYFAVFMRKSRPLNFIPSHDFLDDALRL